MLTVCGSASIGRERGVVAIEFALLFPVVAALIYGAAVYAVIFHYQIQMQSAVDQAASSVLHLDRNQLPAAQLAGAVELRANALLENLVAGLPRRLSDRLDDELTGCVLWSGEQGGIALTLLQCDMQATGAQLFPTLSFGMLGQFPPVPDTVRASARIAF